MLKVRPLMQSSVIIPVHGVISTLVSDIVAE